MFTKPIRLPKQNYYGSLLGSRIKEQLPNTCHFMAEGKKQQNQAMAKLSTIKQIHMAKIDVSKAERYNPFKEVVRK